MDLHILVGLGRIDGRENKRAKLCGKIFTVLMTLIGLSLLWRWHYDKIAHHLPALDDFMFALAIWLFFVFETLFLFLQVHNKKRFIIQNWMNVVVIITCLPVILFRSQYFLKLFVLVEPWLALLLLLPWFYVFVRNSLAEHRLRLTLFTVFCLVIVSGFLISGVDPGIETPWEGFWWAWVTISTVGYGDYVPLSIEGRIFASILIFFGLGFFALLAANFSAFFLKKDVRLVEKRELDILVLLEKLETMEEDQHKVMLTLNRLDQKLQSLEEGFVEVEEEE